MLINGIDINKIKIRKGKLPFNVDPDNKADREKLEAAKRLLPIIIEEDKPKSKVKKVLTTKHPSKHGNKSRKVKL